MWSADKCCCLFTGEFASYFVAEVVDFLDLSCFEQAQLTVYKLVDAFIFRFGLDPSTYGSSKDRGENPHRGGIMIWVIGIF